MYYGDGNVQAVYTTDGGGGEPDANKFHQRFVQPERFGQR